jgi:TPP-dependent indolepyruvate ferredoxin oxidoreductase alpha subunit
MPHLATFFVLHQAGRKAVKGRVIYSGDVGCYALGFRVFDLAWGLALVLDVA